MHTKNTDASLLAASNTSLSRKNCSLEKMTAVSNPYKFQEFIGKMLMV
jgi:hypothetical protein